MTQEILTEPGVCEQVGRRWRSRLREPGWHLELAGELQRYVLERPAEPTGWRIRWTIYDTVATALEVGEVWLPSRGPDRDAARAPLRLAVLHHSATLPDISAARLSAMGLLRLYAPAAIRSGDVEELYSHHRRDDRPVFHAYHWIVRPDGRGERLLEDHEVGWHAGNREVNHASVGICIAGDYAREPPPPAALARVGELLRSQYSGLRLLPHSAVNPDTDCPGRWADGGVLARLGG
jgi:hypothetical protein